LLALPEFITENSCSLKREYNKDVWLFVDETTHQPSTDANNPESNGNQASNKAMPDDDLKDHDSHLGSLLAVRQSGLSQSLPELDSAWWTKVEKHRPSRVKKVRLILCLGTLSKAEVL